MRELCKLAIVLTVICCGAALSLAYVYNLTKEPIAYQQRLKKIKAINSVFPGHESSSEPDTVEMSAGKNEKGENITRKFYVIKKDESVSGVAFEITASGYGGNIKIMVGVAKDAIITGIKIIGHTETPDWGQMLQRKVFINSLKGRT
jgi:electron transport complex protein RnfG